MPGFFLAYLLALSGSVSDQAPNDVGMIRMHVVPLVDQRSPSLEFHLTYTGQKAIKVGSSSVPGNRIAYSIHFEVESFSRFDIEPFYACPAPKKRYIVDDPGHNEMLLEPGRDYVQRIDLTDHVSNLSDLLGKCDLVVFWAYHLDVIDDLAAPRIAGAVVIPQSLVTHAPTDVTADLSFR